jgi:dihydroneopterin aldolase
MDIVFIEQLSVITTIGVYDWEQTIEQKLVFDIEMGWDNRKSAKSDDVNDCLSYADISETVIGHVEGQRFALVERVAEEVAELLLKNSTHRGCASSEQTGRGGARGKRGRHY